MLQSLAGGGSRDGGTWGGELNTRKNLAMRNRLKKASRSMGGETYVGGFVHRRPWQQRREQLVVVDQDARANARAFLFSQQLPWCNLH